MNRRKFLGVTAVAGTGALAGCIGNGEEKGEESETGDQTVDSKDAIKRYVDEEAGVVCYTYKKGYGGGLSCVPIDQTELSNENE